MITRKDSLEEAGKDLKTTASSINEELKEMEFEMDEGEKKEEKGKFSKT